MGARERTYGHDFERMVASDLRTAFPAATVHRSSQADRAYASDVCVEGEAPTLVHRIWWECQTAADPTPIDKLAQAERDLADFHGRGALAPWKLPVVVWRRKRSRTVNATMRLATLNLLAHQRPVCRGDSLDGVVVTVEWGDLIDLLKADKPAQGGGA